MKQRPACIPLYTPFPLSTPTSTTSTNQGTAGFPFPHPPPPPTSTTLTNQGLANGPEPHTEFGLPHATATASTNQIPPADLPLPHPAFGLSPMLSYQIAMWQSLLSNPPEDFTLRNPHAPTDYSNLQLRPPAIMQVQTCFFPYIS